jgi:drug/metabolite transporter (DMT)-like permease
MVIDHFSPQGDGVVMSCIQFFVCGVVSGIIMLFVETPSIENIIAAAMPILYAGVLSSGVAYTLQIVGQKDMNPNVASLILCLESVVSA